MENRHVDNEFYIEFWKKKIYLPFEPSNQKINIETYLEILFMSENMMRSRKISYCSEHHRVETMHVVEHLLRKKDESPESEFCKLRLYNFMRLSFELLGSKCGILTENISANETVDKLINAHLSHLRNPVTDKNVILLKNKVLTMCEKTTNKTFSYADKKKSLKEWLPLSSLISIVHFYCLSRKRQLIESLVHMTIKSPNVYTYDNNVLKINGEHVHIHDFEFETYHRVMNDVEKDAVVTFQQMIQAKEWTYKFNPINLLGSGNKNKFDVSFQIIEVNKTNFEFKGGDLYEIQMLNLFTNFVNNKEN